jgi:hypothetical protein
MKGPHSDTPTLDDILARDFAQLKVGEANLPSESLPQPKVATENEDTAPIVYNQRIDAVEKRESFAVKAPETSTPPSTNEVERPAPPTILTSPTSKEGDDFDVDW